MKRTKRNGKIELIRFLFAIAIVLYHAQKHYMDVAKDSLDLAFFARGYIGVEFFFLLAGFFMAKSIYRKTHDGDGNLIEFSGGENYDLGLETVQYTWRKVKAILPWHFTAFFIMFAATAVLGNYSVRKMCVKFLNMIPNLLFFNKVGFDFGNLNRVEWYITCMIFAIMILYPICRKYYSMFVHVIGPVGGLFLLGYITENFGTFTNTSRWNGFMFICMIRAIAEIALGMSTFEISRVLGTKVFSSGKRMVLTVLEWGGIGFIALFVMSTIDTKYEIYAVFVMMMVLALTLSGQVYGNELFDRPVCYFLGKASLPIYLSQVLPLDFVREYVVHYSPWEKTGIMLTLTLLNAVLCAAIVKGIGYIWRKTVKNKK